MKRALKDSLKLAAFSIVFLLAFACNDHPSKQTGKAATKYTCPMHPQIVANEPGSCPICGMDLVPVKSHVTDDTITAGLENIIKPANQLVLSKIRTVRPEEGVRTGEIEIQGIINYDTNNWNAVSSRVGGRIERLYINYNYQYVNKGQKLMDIYSPDLASAQQELLYLRSSGDKALLESAKTKLRVLGATNQQIASVLKTGKVDYTFSIYSPYSGYVAEKRNTAAAGQSSASGGTVITQEGESAGGMNIMGAGSGSSAGQIPQIDTNSPLQIREGQYLAQGQKVFDLINSNSVFADFFASTRQLSSLKRGMAVQVTALDNPSQKAISKVSLIQPYFTDGNTFSLVRARISNGGLRWKIGQLITVKAESESAFGTWLPRTAVLQTGSKFIAFVKNGGAFVPAYVSVAVARGDWVNIGDSLNKKAEVAVNAWFMVDSESFVKVDSLKR
ncbi:MAG: efflux RND transporter periplasmic adaptor subunit [Sphingobacteriaceae bacterium]|nr:efflux RND transporter periplasmic adaptor subunit [Sphingobacteriaceae bacterium]